MAYTVDAAFNTFFEAINLSGDHRATANARKDNVVRILSNKFEIVDAFASGSIPKYTALKGIADLDVMVVLHYAKHIKGRMPAAVVQEVRDALAAYRTGARKNGQAVTLAYDTWPNVDIVPVSYWTDASGNITHYEVPDTNTGTWIKSRPKHFADSIEAKATKCGGNFRRIIKMIKWWNSIHSDYMQSYHIETLALNVFDRNLDDTAWSVFQFFDKARPLLANALWYDLGYVDTYLSYSDRQEVIKRFDTAITTSRLAWYNTSTGNNPAAIGLWRQIFGDKFPNYG